MPSELERPHPSEPAVGSAEEGRTALGVDEGGPSWLNVPLYGILVIGVLFILIALVMGWASWILLLGALVALAGVGIAVNPGRASPSGATERD